MLCWKACYRNMEKRNILIWGAGRIGRGFIGDLFSESGYHLVFVDQSDKLIELLSKNGHYTVVRALSDTVIKRIQISDYDALHVSQAAEIEKAVENTDLIAVAVFPQSFESTAIELADLILKRKAVRPNAPINIILCTNLIHAGPIFKEYLWKNLSADEKKFFEENVGVVESLVIRIAPVPPACEVEIDPLVVWTNGYSELPVEAKAFQGQAPSLSAFRMVRDMRSEEKRKIYTYNMCHAVLSYRGDLYGHELLVDCLADPAVRVEAEGALGEISQALQAEYGFSKAEMDAWIQGVFEQTNNRTVGDSVVRSAADPLRKLHRDDRLIGPALLCMKHSIKPAYLIRAIGAAFSYNKEDDQNSRKLLESIHSKGISNTIKEVCGLGDTAEEMVMAQEIEIAYQDALVEKKWHEMAVNAYKLGFEYEKVYHGCGQCVYAAASEVLGCFERETFEAATGLSGGVGLLTDCTCSAFTGAVLVIGNLFPRRRQNFGGDRENKYANFALVQQLHDRFVEEFGSITCACVHQKKYGRTFDMRSNEERDQFEACGAHSDAGCPELVGKVAQFTVEILKPALLSQKEEKKI
ncbi:MAG: hypothetical protein GYA48_11745 [Chloroflexi bacterium]|nr:hypothetical protein [Chloroflexota bacterium]